MLISLQVQDFAIVDKIDVEFANGMTALTGETGAGKSILIDALGLVLGERGNAQLVRHGAKRAEFAAEFDIARLPLVEGWLQDNELDGDESCLVRRVINSDGRSRAFINGTAVPIAQLKSIGELLIDIHGQHFHQSLARKSIQRELLDHFAGLQSQCATTTNAFGTWQQLVKEHDALVAAVTDRSSRLDLLSFQLNEIESLSISGDEYSSLLTERQRLQNSGRLADGVNSALETLTDGEAGNVSGSLAGAQKTISALAEVDATLQPLLEMLDSASIQVAETAESLRRYSDDIDMDPQRRDWVEERLDALQTLARKHHVDADDLSELQERLKSEFDALNDSERHGEALAEKVDVAQRSFLKHAKKLSKARAKSAKTFAKEVTTAMAGLGMPDGLFEVSIDIVEINAAKATGIDDIEFLISANPGQSPQSLSKIASGGELSRMSLAIQVIASDGSAIPTMIFDEVDSGVGGGVAEMVGRRLQQLGSDRQVLCVTHLPQVASLADQHFRISKVSDGKSTRTGVQVLSHEERVDELARMLGGVDITQKTLDHAAEMLASSPRKSA